MELPWLVLPTAILIPIFFLFLQPSIRKYRRLPPGPFGLPLLGNPLYLQYFDDTIHVLNAEKQLHKRYGPVVGLRAGTVHEVTVSDRHLSHTALVSAGTALADRPEPTRTLGFIMGGSTISAINYGPLWRLLRKNLVTAIARPAMLKQFSPVRESVLAGLTGELWRRQEGSVGVAVKDAFHHAMFHLAIAMCFGKRLDDDAVRDMEVALEELVMYGVSSVSVFVFFRSLRRRLSRGKLEAMRGKLHDMYVPLVDARREGKKKLASIQRGTALPHSYVDSLLSLRLDFDGGRCFTDDEVFSLCTEFLTQGTETTITALEWIMGELVKNQHIQDKVYEEVKAISSGDQEELQQMQYLRAVVLEGLRRHPPAHVTFPHAAAEDIELGGCVIAKGTTVNFMLADLSMDEKTWEKPTEFRPERFLVGGDGHGVDITGTKEEMKMVPFGAGRRVCPGIAMATVNLEYFVASLVRAFEWREAEGEKVDVITETVEFAVCMKKPLRVRLVQRAA